MRRISRWPIFTAVVLVLALGGLTSFASPPYVLVSSDIWPVDGARDSRVQVEVLRDSYGVPHIYADNPEDLFQAQGYVQAQDRFFEMDFRRHLAAGRLSELFGISQLETDAYVRTLGWRRVAEQSCDYSAPSTRRYLDAYAAGVNAYIEGRTAPISRWNTPCSGCKVCEYTHRAVDGRRLGRLAQGHGLGSRVESRPRRPNGQSLAGKLGAGRAASLFPRYPLGRLRADSSRRGDVVGKAFDPYRQPVIGAPFPGGLSDDQLRKATKALEAVAKINRAHSARARLAALEARDRIQLLGHGRYAARSAGIRSCPTIPISDLDPSDLRSNRAALPCAIGGLRLSTSLDSAWRPCPGS